MTEYFIPTGASETELVEKRSRFLGHVWPVESEGEARARETFATVGGILAAALRDLLVEHGVECLLLGGQISRSFAYMEAALRDGLRDVAGLTRIAPAEHIGEAAFYGLLAQADGVC